MVRILSEELAAVYGQARSEHSMCRHVRESQDQLEPGRAHWRNDWPGCAGTDPRGDDDFVAARLRLLQAWQSLIQQLKSR